MGKQKSENQLTQSSLVYGARHVPTKHEEDLAMSKALVLGAAALVFSIATASAADLVAPVDGEAAPVPAPPPQVYAAPPGYAAPVYTAPTVVVVPPPVYAAPVVTAPVVTAPVLTAPPVVSHRIYAYAPGYWGGYGHGWHGGWHGHGHWHGWH
jgi:hypothetical protein